MGAATRESTATAVHALEIALKPTATGRQRAGADAVGPQLLSAARAIASSPQLAQLLAEFDVEHVQKAALISRVFAGFDKRTLAVLNGLTTSRWSDHDDLVAAVEELGLRAVATTSAADIDGELFVLERAVVSDPAVELALGSAVAPIAARVALIDRLLSSATPATQEIGRHIAELPRGRRIIEALHDAQRIIGETRGRLVAVATSATPLSTAQARLLEDRLTARYGRKIAINQVVDPALLGGVRIAIGDDVIDGTIRSRLDDLRIRLAG